MLDLCAAPGGKTGHLAELMGDQGEIVAVEKNAARAEVLRGTVARLGYRSVRVVEGDGTQLEWDEPFHRVLVDAPCTGLGVLARRADARWRKRPEHLTRMSAVQRELLDAGSRAVRRGGVLVYSVCSFEPEETEGVVSWFLERHPEFRRVSGSGLVADAVLSEAGALTCLPHVHGTDGVYAARLEHVESFASSEENDEE